MMKKLGLAGISLLLSWSVAGCEKVEKCKRDEPGCVHQLPINGDECSAGLELSSGGTCEEPSNEGLPSYCDDAEEVPETTLLPRSCKARSEETLTFEDVCRRRCRQRCARAEIICEGFTCDQNCDGPAVLPLCTAECGTAADPVACLTDRCLELQGTRCEMFECPADNPRNCDDVKCSDSCTGNTNDTFCDDGDPSSALYALCAFGTDCTDCLPRRGGKPPRSPIQGLCPAGRDVACEGYNDEYPRNESFCVHVDGTQAGQFSCVPDCTNDDEDCEDGFECQALVYMNGKPYEDLDGVQGYACFPTFCGQ